MLTTLLYLFTFSSWGLGLLAALTALSMKLQEHGVKIKAANLEISSKTSLIDSLMGNMPGSRRGSGIPEELKNLMKSSPNHPEVEEIEEDDEVFGIVFQSHNYPPSLDRDNNDEQDS